jgi:hypothetical protein
VAAAKCILRAATWEGVVVAKSILDMWEVLLLHPDTYKYVDMDDENRLFETEKEAIQYGDEMHRLYGYGYEIWPGKD